MDGSLHDLGAIGRKAGKVTPAMLAHIVLRTGQSEKMVEWYSTLLNAEVVFGNKRITFLTYDEEHHRIAIANMPVTGRRNKSRAGVDHIAFTYASLGDLLENWERLHRLGIDPVWCTNHGPTTSMYYEDPDGNIIELQIDNFDSYEDLEAWAVDSDFETNPIGVDFDPAQLKRRYDAGEDEGNLKIRLRIGPRSATTIPSAYTGRFVAFLAHLAQFLGRKA